MSKIPAPTTNDMPAAEAARWHADMAILAADPRTANGANRPAWLVERVLREARAAKPGTSASATELLDRAAAVKVTGRSAIDQRGVAMKDALLTQARVALGAELEALRAELAQLRSSRAA